ncbi:hypothetical protein BH10ACT11_BH10ACT11_17670 [soil metagenome]
MANVSILIEDPDLGADLDADSRSRAMRASVARVISLGEGSWEAEGATTAAERRGWFGLLVLSGVLCRRVGQGERYGSELLGTGDLLRPWDRIADLTTLPVDSDWSVVTPVELAVLDHEFARRTAQFPELSASLISRALQRSRYLAVLAAIASQPRVETRLHMLFWHLADRFGTLSGKSVTISLPLTHSMLGELVAARRQSVSSGLSALSSRGILDRNGREWLLSGPVPTAYENLRDLN